MHYGIYLVADDSTYDDYIYLAPIKTGTTPSGADNDRYYKNNFMIWPDSMGVVFKKVKDPDTLEKWYDIIYDPYYGSQVRYGMDGVHIKLNANNQFEQITTPPAPYQNFADWYFATHFQMAGYNTRALCDLIYNLNRESREQVTKDEFYMPYFINEPLPFIPQTSTESAKISSYPDIGKLVTDMTPQWISGERDINRDWPEYLRQLDQLGLKDYTAAYQSYVTRFETNWAAIIKSRGSY
jgi:putative aldouronate transport system substrate-binding protein